MGAGKTTVARALARRLDWRVADIDELIERREHLTVSELFARQGESYFRAVERAVLLEQIGVRHTVVATGGGTFVDPQNRALINADGASVWLDVPLGGPRRARAGGWPAPACRRPHGVRAALPRPARRLRTGAPPNRRRPRQCPRHRRTTGRLAGSVTSVLVSRLRCSWSHRGSGGARLARRRGGRISGVSDRRATPPSGMHRRPNANDTSATRH